MPAGIRRVFYCLLSLCILNSCSKDKAMNAVYPVEDRIILQDLAYGNDLQQKMDLFLPANRNPSTRAVIFIHGGGWNKGDKKDFFNIPLAFADSGIAAASLNYRLADTVRRINYYDILSDIEKAIAFLRERDKLYNCSFDTVTVFGKSAGAHLALLYAYQKKNVVKVVALAAPTNLNDVNLLNAGEMYACVNNMIGSDNVSQRTFASPVHYTDSVATRLYHGKKDALVPYYQSVSFYNKIRTLNSQSSLTLFENAEHEILGDELHQLVRETIDWVKE